MSLPVEMLCSTAATLGAAMLVLWGVSLLRHDASIADPFWGMGFVLVAAVAMPPNAGPRQLAVLAMTCLWGVRLSVHLLQRNLKSGEDPRYQAMRRKHGAAFGLRSLVTVFGAQGAILWGVSLPLQAAMAATAAPWPGGWDLLGMGLWAAGLTLESVADRQLLAHRRDPAQRERVLQRGLWRLSRHPNYFGEALLWWGFGLLGVGAGAPWTLLSPLAMTLLLRLVSGVPLLEASLRRRRPEYAAYAARTSAFVPWWPRDRGV